MLKSFRGKEWGMSCRRGDQFTETSVSVSHSKPAQKKLFVARRPKKFIQSLKMEKIEQSLLKVKRSNLFTTKEM